MSNQISFVDKLVDGQATVNEYDEYDDYVDMWHDLPEGLDTPSLHEFLGLSWEEYQVVARDALAFRFVAMARKQKTSLMDVLETQAEHGFATRSQDS